MNNQTLLLLAMGAFVTLIVAVAAIDQYLLDKHPPTEIAGLLWRIDSAFGRVKDLEATIQVTHEAYPADNLRMKMLYVKGPPSALSLRYLRSQDTNDVLFAASLRDETFTIEGDLILHYLPREGLIISKRWLGFPLASLGLNIFDVSQIQADWEAGRVSIRILQPVAAFSPSAQPPLLTTLPSFADVPATAAGALSTPDFVSSSTRILRLLSLLETREAPAMINLGVASALDAESAGTAVGRSYVLEVRDAATENLQRMVWVDRESYLVQKVVTFTEGQRNATLVVQLLTLDQGLLREDVVVRPQPGIPTIRG